MNCAKTLRDYCLKNKGKVLDVAFIHNKYFSMFDYKTLLKTLNRIEEEQILTKISKGVYLINDDNMSIIQAVKDFYVGDASGLIIGYSMYNKYDVTDVEKEIIEVLSTKIIGNDKTVLNYHISSIDMPVIFESDKKIIIAFELVEHMNNIERCNTFNLLKAVTEIIESEFNNNSYSISSVLKKRKYMYSTIVTIQQIVEQVQLNSPPDIIKIFNDIYGG